MYHSGNCNCIMIVGQDNRTKTVVSELAGRKRRLQWCSIKQEATALFLAGISAFPVRLQWASHHCCVIDMPLLLHLCSAEGILLCHCCDANIVWIRLCRGNDRF